MAIPYANPATLTLELQRAANNAAHRALRERAYLEIRDCFPILNTDFFLPVELAVAESTVREYLAPPPDPWAP